MIVVIEALLISLGIVKATETAAEAYMWIERIVKAWKKMKKEGATK